MVDFLAEYLFFAIFFFFIELKIVWMRWSVVVSLLLYFWRRNLVSVWMTSIAASINRWIKYVYAWPWTYQGWKLSSHSCLITRVHSELETANKPFFLIFDSLSADGTDSLASICTCKLFISFGWLKNFDCCWFWHLRVFSCRNLRWLLYFHLCRNSSALVYYVNSLISKVIVCWSILHLTIKRSLTSNCLVYFYFWWGFFLRFVFFLDLWHKTRDAWVWAMVDQTAQ
jgi:hypothetical protein